MDKCLTTNDVSCINTFLHQKVPRSIEHEAGDKNQRWDSLSKKVRSHKSRIKQIKSTKPEQVPPPAIKQRSAAVRAVFSYADHSVSQEATHQSLSPGEFYFANDPLTQQRIIDQLRHEQSATYCLRSLDDLEKHGLMRQTWLEGGQLQKAEGRLFIDKPLTLVFDLTTMTPGDIASFKNQLAVK